MNTPKKIDITDRSNCFYWQTDRTLTPEEYQTHFLKRQEISEAVLQKVLINGSKSIPDIETLQLVPPDRNVLKGNVNIVRKFRVSEKLYVARLHPPHIKNGYFFVEATALEKTKQNGLPVPQAIEVHVSTHENDLDFMIETASPGMTMEFAIQENPQMEQSLLRQAGQHLAYIHQIKVEKFGFFDNTLAQEKKELVGIHSTNKEFIFCGLEENISRLIKFEVIDQKMASYFLDLFTDYDFSFSEEPRLIHNDYADWNILVENERISAILDWDECCGGDPIADLACWSTFYDMTRFPDLLKGYSSAVDLPEDFEARFHYYRLRYSLSKMALRVKRAVVDKSQFVQDKILVGKQALKEEVAWFQKNI